MSNLIDIQTQIEKLQKQANDIKAREFDKTVQEILAKMQAFGITLKNLQPKKGARAAKASSAAGKLAKKGAPKKPVTSVAAKYRGPEGQTWTGRGLTPRWLASLVAEGRSKEDFAIHP